MADKQTQALKRLTKKLSALRKTLRKDERDLLDQLILGEGAAEVSAHKFSSKASSKAAEVEAHKFTPKAATKAAEVVVHSMAPKASPKASQAAVEVTAHKLSASSRPVVSYNASTGSYIVVEEEPEVAGHSFKAAASPIAATVLKEKAAT